MLESYVYGIPEKGKAMRQGAVIVASGVKPYGFWSVAREISAVLEVPLVEISKNKLNYLHLFKDRLDFIIAVGTLSPVKILVSSLAARRVIAYISVEGPFPISQRLKLLINKLKNIIVAVPSNYVRRELSFAGLKVNCIIPHGINIDKVSKACKETKLPFHLPKDKVRVLLVLSSLQKRKLLGAAYLLKQLSRLPVEIRKECFTIVKVPKGKSDMIRKLLSLYGIDCRDLLIIDRYLTHNELYKLYASSDLYIHPTLSDGFGLPVLESLASGTPVIVLDAEPWKEIATNDVGWFVHISKEVIGWEGGLPYRLKIPDLDDLALKLRIALESIRNQRELIRRKCIERARIFDSRKVYRKFFELMNEKV